MDFFDQSDICLCQRMKLIVEINFMIIDEIDLREVKLDFKLEEMW